MSRRISPQECQEYEKLLTEPVQDGDMEGQRRKMNALYWLAHCHITGTGGKEHDPKQGIRIVEQVVQEQDRIANDNLHDMTGKHRWKLAFTFQFITDDKPRASALFRQAVPRLHLEVQVDGEDEFGESAWDLGLCYYHGMGVEEDRQQGIHWWIRATELGSELGQFNVSHLCRHSSTRCTERKILLDWFHQRAIEQEEAWVQFVLGYCYGAGNGVAKDVVKAVEYYNKAIAQAHEDAPGSKQALLNGLGMEERNRALGCVKRNENIKTASSLIQQSSGSGVPVGLWPFAIVAFQHQEHPPWEAPSPTFLLLCGAAPQLQNRVISNHPTQSEE